MLGFRAPCALALALAAVSILLGACGGSSATRSVGATATTPGPGAPVHADLITNGQATSRPTKGTGGHQVNDDSNPGRADSGAGASSGQLHPCALVPLAQARAIIGPTPSAPQEAPLGPTCIYEQAGAKHSVTVSVATSDFSRLRSQIRNRKQARIGTHTAYCGIYGQPTTFVPLARGLVLNIVAPCAVGARLAAVALPRLKA